MIVFKINKYLNERLSAHFVSSATAACFMAAASTYDTLFDYLCNIKFYNISLDNRIVIKITFIVLFLLLNCLIDSIFFH